MSWSKFPKLPIHLQKLGSHFPRCFILVLILPHFFQKSKPFSIKIFTHKLSRIFKFWKARLQVSQKLKFLTNLSWFFQCIKFWKNDFRLHSKTHFIRKNKVTILKFKDHILHKFLQILCKKIFIKTILKINFYELSVPLL